MEYIYYLVAILVPLFLTIALAMVITLEDWLNPIIEKREQEREHKEHLAWLADEEAAEKEIERAWQAEKKKKAQQAAETKQRQAILAAEKAARRAAHQERTHRNKLKKQQARLEYSLRKKINQ